MSTSNYLPSLYQQFIHKSRYARWLWDDNRRETWEETVSRFMKFFDEHLQENNNYKLTKSEKKLIEESIISLQTMPSMRCLMTAGEALKRENISAYNCFGGNTNILTKEYGLTNIKNILNKEVSILTSDKSWIKTKIKEYGIQNLSKIQFRVGNSKNIEEVMVTDNHDWVLEDNSRTKTSELKKGTIIPLILNERLPFYEGEDYRLGIIHGLIYGDGTQQKHKKTSRNKNIISCERNKGYIIRLCSDQLDLLPFFDGYPISYPESYGGDPVVYLYDNFAKTHLLKELPSKDETEAYLVGFFRGWLAADGYVCKNTGETSICVGEKEEIWLRNIMPIYGIHFNASHFLPSETNYGTRKKESKILDIWRASLNVHDFIIKRKRDNFKPLNAIRKVFNVIKTNISEMVYCCEVPNYHNFVIEKGILTGNCTYVAIDSPRSFDEIVYILMNGTGVGFSVEQKYVDQLPLINDEFYDTDTTIVVADSKLGWAKATKELIHLLYSGQVPKWDMSKLRPAGAPLKTFGGRASGPAPLNDLFNFMIMTFKKAAGRKLTTLECHDIVCKIAEIVVVGGVRRSALISLSDLSDDRMRLAKSGDWWKENVQRALANNSYVIKEKIDVGIFMREWISLYESRSGERGIFSRSASKKQAEKFGRRDPNHAWGCNPCSEIILRSRQACNLSEVILRENDTKESIREKVRIATIIGTMQATLTNFKYISKKWKENCEEERLLGVSLTGIMDCPITNGTQMEGMKEFLEEIRNLTVEVNKEWAAKLHIPASTAITCVKPSGCMDKDTKIKTNKGIMSLEDVFNYMGYNIYDYNQGTWLNSEKELFVLDENNEQKRITNLFVNGISEIYELTDENGQIFKFTGEHEVKIKNKGWVRVDSIQEGDDIISF